MSESPSAASSSEQPSSSGAKVEKLEYLEQKYGNKVSHVNLSREEVDAMVDKVLRDSPTVQYLLQSLKQVRYTQPHVPVSQQHPVHPCISPPARADSKCYSCVVIIHRVAVVLVVRSFT